ncbi:globin-coupled sensor protein [Affinirhizobium pseudoryzae]|uniref:globin-coupled sensor protein n=1 Tax=Allorhizobium pseudoryzae TaxID=379684 RepID=UPI0013ED6A6C|nr:globin-coupled sensor protein [Allorhizobium pseudoryzae]
MTTPETLKDLNERLDFAGLNEPARRVLSEMQPLIRQAIGPALDDFYDKAKKHPHTASFFSSAGHIAHAKARQEQHWAAIASGKYDASYVDAVSTVGRTHARLGLEPRWYIGGYTLILEGIIKAVVASELKGFLHAKKAKTVEEKISAVVKAALIDMDYAISVYLDELAAARKKIEDERQKAALEQETALAALDRALRNLSDRNLNFRMTEQLSDGFSRIKSNYNESITELNGAMLEIRGAVAQVLAEIGSISGATDDMAKRTEQQASALEQTAAAIEEITTISASAAQRTAEVQTVVRESAEEAVRSGKVVEEAISAMGQIEGSSQKMTQIIGAIDEIAFQTNLLALNAGVEAARAGEQGKGFAVVAQEVRELAQRSAAAAKEIKELIDQSAADVNRGVDLVNRTGKALVTIGDRVNTISEHISWIAQSAREQSSGIDEINAAIRSIDQITQRNAALTEETNASTQNLAGISSGLSELLSRFKTSSSHEQARHEDRERRSA